MKTNKKLKSAIKKIAVMVLGVFLFAGCNITPEDDGTTPPPLFLQPQSIAANPEDGYVINIVTGDSIQPIINSIGDTLKTGVPIPAIGKYIDPDSVAKPNVIKVNEENFEKKFFVQNNLFEVPEKLDTIPVDENSLTIKIVPNIGNDDTTHYMLNNTGQKVLTGVPIPAEGKKVIAKQPQPKQSLPMRTKEHAISNLQYLDEDQGMPNSFVTSIVEDQNGNLWFGDNAGGLSRYDGQFLMYYTKKEGLTYGAISTMLEDRKGNLWIGTNEGLIKYDGKYFTHFTEKDGLTRKMIRTMAEDKNGNLWFGFWGGGGLTSYDGKTFVHYTEKEGLSHNYVVSILEDKKGNLWVGTAVGLCRFNGKSFTHYTEKEGLSNNYVSSILEDKNGNIWFGTSSGVSKYDGKTFVNFTKKEGLSSNRVSLIVEDKSGNIWFGTFDDGVCKFDGKSFTYFAEKEGLSGNRVSSIVEDKNGNIWIGTYGGGVNKFNVNSIIQFAKSDGLNNKYVLSIAEDKSGNLWFGTQGSGAIKYDGKSFTHFFEKEGLSKYWVSSIFEDKKGNIWFGTAGVGAIRYDGNSFTHYTENEGLSNYRISSISEDNNGNIWLGSAYGEISKYDGKTFTNFMLRKGMEISRVRSILEDKNGNIWFGTAGGGVSIYDGSSFTHFTEKEGLSRNDLTAMVEDRNGNIWMGTRNGGVSKYDGQTFTHLTGKEGLSSNIVRSILEDKNGNLWFGTQGGGVSKLVLSNVGGDDAYHFTHLNKMNGLSNNHVDKILEDKNGNLWFVTSDGVVNMLDVNSSQNTTQLPQIYLRQLYINENLPNYRIREDPSVQFIKFDSVKAFENYPINPIIPYDQNHLSFQFSAIDWSAPNKIKYSFRLIGLDNKWSIPSDKTLADYRNLPDGKFIFQVRAIGASGEWSEALEYSFTILPPWWKTWWAHLGYLFLFLGALRTFSHWRERKLYKEKELLRLKVDERTSELQESLENLKSTQAQLIHAEKMASLGELTAGIAHEIKNPLNFVNNFSDVSMEMIDEAIDEVKAQGIAPQAEEDILEILVDIKSNLSKIHEHGSRADGIVKSMLMHSRGGSGKKEPTVLNELVKEYVNLSFHGMRAGKNPINVDIQLDLDESIEKVDLVAEDFSRVIINLCNNAFDACAERSRSTMRTAETQRIASLNVRTKKHKDTITIEIEDNGPGIPDDIKDKILQPFFTTKKGTEGTGLGLSITHDIVKAHGGEIIIESREGEGTKFIIILKL